MVVQLILASRMGTRELESDEEDENAFEVPREQLSKFTGKAPPTKLQLQEAIEKAAIEADKKQNNNSSNDSKDNDKNDSADATPVDEKKLDDSSLKPETETKKTEVEAKPETTETSNNDTVDEKMDVDKENSSNEEEKTTNSETKENNLDSDQKPEKMEVNDEKPSEKATLAENEVSEKPVDPAPAVKKPLNKTARMIEVEEYLVKFKNFSYLHCQWLTEEELHRGDKRISQKIKRFKQKREKSINLMDLIEDEHFNPDYIEVDRVLDSSTHTDEQTNVMTKHFLVKWRSLPYEDCTWELESDVDPNKIKEYIKWKDPPPEEKIYKRR